MVDAFRPRGNISSSERARRSILFEATLLHLIRVYVASLSRDNPHSSFLSVPLTSGPLTLKNGRPHSVATALASSVFPGEGGNEDKNNDRKRLNTVFEKRLFFIPPPPRNGTGPGDKTHGKGKTAESSYPAAKTTSAYETVSRGLSPPTPGSSQVRFPRRVTVSTRQCQEGRKEESLPVFSLLGRTLLGASAAARSCLRSPASPSLALPHRPT